MSDFESYFISKNDEVDNAAFDLIGALALSPVKWNMEIIGEVEEAVKDVLATYHIDICHPFILDDETPCFQSDDCWNINCPFKSNNTL